MPLTEIGFICDIREARANRVVQEQEVRLVCPGVPPTLPANAVWANFLQHPSHPGTTSHSCIIMQGWAAQARPPPPPPPRGLLSSGAWQAAASRVIQYQLMNCGSLHDICELGPGGAEVGL